MHQVVNPGQQESKNPIMRLSKAIADRRDSFAAVATKYLDADRLIKLAHACLTKTPALADCTLVSILDSLIVCARLGLEPNERGGVWLVPYGAVCTPIIDYRGALDVCRRSGAIAAVHCDIRCEKDHWKYMVDTNSPNMVTLEHAPADGDRGKFLGAFFVMKLTSGQCQATYLSEEEINRFRDRSKAFKSKKGISPWHSDYNAMAKKTVVHRGVNLAPRTPDVQILREELGREEREDDIHMIPIGEGDVFENSQDAIRRMLEAIKEDDPASPLADQIVDAFKQLDYGPARQLQMLTQHNGDPKGLLDHLNGVLEERQGKKKPADETVDIAVTAADAAGKESNPAPLADQKPKNKGGRPKKKPAEQAKKPEPNLAKALDHLAKQGTSEGPAPVEQVPDNAKPAKKPFDGGSF